MNKAKLAVLVAAVAAAALAVLLSSSSTDDVVVMPRMLEIREGDSGFEMIPVDAGATGPESFAFDNDGAGPYTGMSDGRVIRWLPDERRWVDHSSSAPPELLESCRGSQDPSREPECGRPLGLKFHKHTGELYVADAYHGLRVVAPGANVSRPLLPAADARPSFFFANGVEIDYRTGAVYFTETSTRFQRREFMKIVMTGDTSGRLLKYEPTTNQVEVLVTGLAFPNGIALSEDGSHLLLAETTTGKILRYWLTSSTLETLAQLAWFPDNLKRSPRGGLWVGLHARRGKLAEWCVSYPWLRRALAAVPPRLVQRAAAAMSRVHGRQVVAVRVREDDGRVVEVVSVRGGGVQKAVQSVSEVEERGGRLFVGSVASPVLGVYRLSQDA